MKRGDLILTQGGYYGIYLGRGDVFLGNGTVCVENLNNCILVPIRHGIPMAAANFAEILQPRMEESPIVHHLRFGVTPCAMRGFPGDWPPLHRWSNDWSLVNCHDCLKCKPKET